MKVIAEGRFGKPSFDRRRLVGSVIVLDQMDIEIKPGTAASMASRKRRNSVAAVAPVAAAEHPAGGNIEGVANSAIVPWRRL